MKSFILILGFIFLTFFVFSQETAYFETKRDYIFKALYIDSVGDTITNEKLIIRIPDRRWIAQPQVQKSVIYIYGTDTTDYKNYVDPDSYFRERNVRLYNKRGKFPIVKKETTGGLESNRYSYLYMHPPRANQYRMLFHAPHPYFFYSALDKEIDTAIITNQQFYGAGYMRQQYIYQKLGQEKFLGDSIEFYSVDVSSELISTKEYYKDKLDFYSSTLDALFCLEYGFVKLHYEFKSGVKIQFDLVEVKENDSKGKRLKK